MRGNWAGGCLKNGLLYPQNSTMTSTEISEQLEGVASSDDFAASSTELADRWRSANVGFEAVEPILRFMEKNPSIDFGMPGSLTHIVERFYGNGYERMLLESISRKPTQQTIWMLNRVINGTKAPAEKQRLVAAMAQAKLNPQADPDALSQINRFLEKLGIKGA
jgi:hypothetical protein